MNRAYELMTIWKADLDLTDTKKRDALFSKLLGDQISLVTETLTLGKKRLAYLINGNSEGIYCLTKLSAARVNMTTINTQAKRMTELVRYLLVKS